ncbi:hypothetical protein FMEAI12_6240002 [Parafrankia sp. Ea1.12]|nr:hypothetical protein FMEAI12_6240002 [Parafrankia sp. Ea1.12]
MVRAAQPPEAEAGPAAAPSASAREREAAPAGALKLVVGVCHRDPVGTCEARQGVDL